MMLKSFRAAVATVAIAAIAACAAPGQPTAQDVRTVTKRSASEQRIGDENHPKILAQFGGEVSDQTLKDYVNRIGRELVRHTEQPRAKWTFTVLDSPVVNAFALPGGYVYVTRGLIALANDEAELAGVIGHEIGHVTAQHSVRRQERATMAQLGVLGATILGAVIGLEGDALRGVGQLGQTLGAGYVASYSREQEFEADLLGVRYIARAGYDPRAEADFLESLQRTSALQARVAKASYDPNRVDFLSTHPATANRVREAIRAAEREGVNVQGGADRRRGRHLRNIDGMVYGDSPQQGFVRGRSFSHPELRFSFTVPEGFRIQNSSAQVTAAGPSGAGIVFSGDRDQGGRMDQYIARRWAPSIAEQARTGPLENLRRITVNGLEAASAQMAVETRNGVRIARMTAIRMDGSIYRFLGIQPQNQNRLGRQMDRAAESFRKLSQREARALRPYRIKVHEVRRGEKVRDLIDRMPFEDFRRERFRVLNGRDEGQKIRAGEKVKLVVE